VFVVAMSGVMFLITHYSPELCSGNSPLFGGAAAHADRRAIMMVVAPLPRS